MRIEIFNDMGRDIDIHPGTIAHGTHYDGDRTIKPNQAKIFYGPDGTYPWVKLWDYGGKQLQVLVSPKREGLE